MKAKLVKVVDDIGAYYVLHGSNLPENYVLSDKNCQSIERGYDLDELADEYYKQFDNLPVIRYNAYVAGFQKALEILGDRRFTEVDIINAYEAGRIRGRDWDKGDDNKHPICSEHLQSIQQNEWEVDIMMECTQCQSYGYVSECRDNCNKKFLQPKLDAHGCLVLKKM